VLIGPTATGVGTPQLTPIDTSMAPVISLAHSVSSILNEDFFIEPEWGFWARMGTFLVIMLYLMLFLPRLKASVAFVLTLMMLLTLVASHYLLMTNNAMWIQLMTPGALLVIGYLLITTKRFLVTERGKARSDEEPTESNRMLGRYEVLKELGKGAMGTVYLGKDPKISRIVAIKTLPLAQEFDADEIDEVKARFFREAETAGRLNHPNIVTIYDAGEDHDLAYIAMEFLKGHDLARYCKPQNLMEIPRIISIVERAAEGLDFAHRQNVVHRDIKPANIMYEPESDTVKITDFGIARITDSSKTKTGTVLGTPSYMSPEQLAGKKVDGRSDLFSLGVMLYQMLSGSLPFKADSMASLMFKITNEEAADIRTIRAEISENLATVVNRALTKDVDQRFQTGIEFANALKVFLKH
jgi:tRNA A-37 threonylcarbamoyl transferase component Bud32